MASSPIFSSLASTLGAMSEAAQKPDTSYTPKNLLPQQIRQESGGKQFDSKGNVLIGHYPDGSTPPDGKKAYGAGQIQIGTARETAQNHGIPWDEQRLMTDRNYNLRLADAHMGDLLKKYGGDSELALAAYHSGSGTVDSAVAKYGRKDFAKGLGPVGRDYIKMAGTSTQPGGYSVPDITNIKPTAAESARIKDGYQGAGANPFQSQGVTEAAQKTAARASLADTLLTQANDEQARIRAQQEAALGKTVAAKDAIIEHGRQITNTAIDQSSALFAKKQQLLDRKTEVRNMNPFLAAIKGAVDPNYNMDDLNAAERDVDSRLQLVDDAYAHDFNMHQTLALLATADYNNQNSLWNLQLANSQADVKAAVDSFISGGHMLDAKVNELQAGSQVALAQNRAVGNFLNDVSTGNLNELVVKADQNGGFINADGLQISGQKLKEEQMRRQDLEYSMVGRKMAIDSQNMAFADRAEDDILSKMNKSEVTRAIQADGMFNGQQLDLTKLGGRLQQLQGSEALQANDALASDAGVQWSHSVQQYTESGKGYVARMTSMFGKLPDRYMQQIVSDNTQLTHLSEQMKALADSGQIGAARQLAMQGQSVIQKMVERRQKAVDLAVKNWSGGNKDLESIGLAWANGSHVEPGAAMRGMIYMARTNPPPGMRFRGVSAEIFNIVRQTTQQFDARQATPAALKGSAADRDHALVQLIQSKISEQYNGRMINDLIDQTPLIAKSISVNGRRHPFSQMSQDDVYDARARGDQEGYALLSPDMDNKKPSEIKDMMAKPSSDPVWKEFLKDQTGEKANKAYWVDRLASQQTQAFYKALDSYQTDSMPVAPSTMYKDLVSRPEFFNAAQHNSVLSSYGTLGGFVATAAAGGGFDNSTMNYARSAIVAFNDYRNGILTRNTELTKGLRYQPLARTSVLLRSIPDLKPDDEAYLMNAIKVGLKEQGLETIGTPGREDLLSPGFLLHGDPSKAAIRQQDSIDSMITNHKFQDPRAEALRRKVAKDWDKYKLITQKLIDSGLIGY